MALLDTALDPRSPSFLDHRSSALAALTRLEAAHEQARDGGGEREVTQHHARGKLLPRERIELLIDRDTALLELAATAGSPVGAGVVTAIGIIEGVECLVLGNDPTLRENGLFESGRVKVNRAVELAQLYRLPIVFLWESGPAANDLPGATGVPVIGASFGAEAQGPLPFSDHVIGLRGHGDPAGADVIAEDERHALRLVREAMRQLCRPALVANYGVDRDTSRDAIGGAIRGAIGGAIRGADGGAIGGANHRPNHGANRGAVPRHESDDLLAVDRADLYEVLARVLDGSEFEELRSHTGAGVVTGFGAVYGVPVAVLGVASAGLDPLAVRKAVELRRKAELAGLVTVVLCAASGGGNPVLGRALAGPDQITVLMGSDPPDWALASRGFRFAWPGLGDLAWDGVIDPRDTRTVLGICLSVLRGQR